MAQGKVSKPISLKLPTRLAAELQAHLFPGDGDEHGAVIGAAVITTGRGTRLLGRSLFLAEEDVDYVPGERGYRMLTADFVRRCALACAADGLAYLAAHNHRGTDHVGFSGTDLASHRRGYPALIDIMDGPPVGGLVFAKRAVDGDIWVSANEQTGLDHGVIVGRAQSRRYAHPPRPRDADPQYDRQIRLFGDRGQEIISSQKVAVIGAGGAGSLISEYLSRLGVGHLVVIDYDRLDPTNYPRVVGACPSDLCPRLRWKALPKMMRRSSAYKVNIAKRVAREANPNIRFDAIVGDVTQPDVARRLIDCDAIFLAADTMQARLVVNAVCHQYLVPAWQVGSKVTNDDAGNVLDVFSVVRQIVPGETCLWCNELVDPTRLAEEAATTEQRAAQRYVDNVPAPSVITLNAVACAHAVDQYLFSTLEIQELPKEIHWMKYRAVEPYCTVELPRQDPTCFQCQTRLAAGDHQVLPVREV